MDNNLSASSPPVIYHFKILVPAAAAGRIIGKGGTTIAQLQKEAGARVKMSKPSEFYPGTTERVCLISGPIEGILKINDFFMENFSSTSVKILVPNSTAGMIIGKAGNYIKQIKEDSGAYVQISQKCADLSSPERCVTIVGELDQIRKACSMILGKIVEDVSTTKRDINKTSISNSGYLPTSLSGNCGSSVLSRSPSPIGSLSDMDPAQIIESIELVLRVSGYAEEAISDITSAMSTLANYGVLGVGLGLI